MLLHGVVLSKRVNTGNITSKIRNSVRNKTRQADRLIQNEIARACKDNPKHFWKEPVGDLIYTNDIGDKITATTDDNKAEVLCDFFSSVFCLEKDGEFPVSNNKKCDTVSEIPSFDLEDIIIRLKKLM